MIPVDEAWQRLCQFVDEASARRVVAIASDQAVGRVLAEPIQASHDHPRFDNSAMDGYAMRLADAAAGRRLQVDRDTFAGDASARLPEGVARRIMTGAPVPSEADLVIPREHVDESDPGAIVIQETAKPAPGANIRRRGEEIQAGVPLLHTGHRVTAFEAAVLEGLGIGTVHVHEAVRVAYLNTGNELVSSDDQLDDAAVIDSNGPIGRQLLRHWDITVCQAGRIADTHDDVQHGLEHALTVADLVLTTGGVSMGGQDYVRTCGLELGLEEIFWKVEQRPGKPLFAAARNNQILIGLPGNPVAAPVGIRRYVIPLIQRWEGRDAERATADASGLTARPKPGWMRWQPVKCITDGDTRVAHDVGAVGSNSLPQLLKSTGFVGLHDRFNLKSVPYFGWLPENP